MKIRSGERLRSTVCETQVIVVKAPDDDVDVRCGGAAMVPLDSDLRHGEPDAGLASGSQLGKRYANPELGLEVLVTSAGVGSLTVGDARLTMKDTKKLPSSD